MNNKQIILRPNQVPKFIGGWKLGEVQQMAHGLLQWLNNLDVNVEKRSDPEKKESKENQEDTLDVEQQ